MDEDEDDKEIKDDQTREMSLNLNVFLKSVERFFEGFFFLLPLRANEAPEDSKSRLRGQRVPNKMNRVVFALPCLAFALPSTSSCLVF